MNELNVLMQPTFFFLKNPIYQHLEVDGDVAAPQVFGAYRIVEIMSAASSNTVALVFENEAQGGEVWIMEDNISTSILPSGVDLVAIYPQCWALNSYTP